MAQIAVTILDPSNNRSAHLVENRLPIRDLIPPIVTLLKLPERATYQLIPLGNENALPVDKTLAEMGIPAGAELQLKPVRNQLLKAIPDKLYEEAEGYVKDQAWELAKAKLEELWQVDPTFPNPRGLESAVAEHVPSLRSVPRTERLTPRRSPPLSGQRAAPTATSTASTTATATPPLSPSGSGAYRLAPTAAKSSGSSCLVISLLVIGVVVVLSLGTVAAVFLLPDVLGTLAERIGIPAFGPTLGTGDVQVTLRWEGEADLDLHVIDPAGDEISYASPESPSGGILDVDANGECQGIQRPVENVYWPTGEAPQGSYQVFVMYYQTCDRTEPTDYEVTITLDGEVFDVIQAQITAEGEQHPVTNFDY